VRLSTHQQKTRCQWSIEYTWGLSESWTHQIVTKVESIESIVNREGENFQMPSGLLGLVEAFGQLRIQLNGKLEAVRLHQVLRNEFHMIFYALHLN